MLDFAISVRPDINARSIKAITSNIVAGNRRTKLQPRRGSDRPITVRPGFAGSFLFILVHKQITTEQTLRDCWPTCPG